MWRAASHLRLTSSRDSNKSSALTARLMVTWLKGKNSSTNIFNSIVGPNISYSQATTPEPNTTTSKNTRQMAARNTLHPRNLLQTEAITVPAINPVPIQNYPLNQANNINIQQTLQLAIFALIPISHAFNGASGITTNLNQISAPQGNPNQLYGLIDASCSISHESPLSSVCVRGTQSEQKDRIFIEKHVPHFMFIQETLT
ncbi:hypothetical protein TNCV_3780981 [Trichonephila clavipes]|nr:hypothetical protein TNCV_3780981 [Trichonephila clavipes]